MAIHFLTDHAGSPAIVLCGWPLYPSEVNHPRLKYALEWSRHKNKVTCKRCLRFLFENKTDKDEAIKKGFTRALYWNGKFWHYQCPVCLNFMNKGHRSSCVRNKKPMEKGEV